MKITGPVILTKALDWFEKQRFQVHGSLEVNSICDSFEQKVRRVPRNICADPAVEAKRAVSNSTKSGLSAFSKSIINCLNEADEAYLLEFAAALQSCAAEYLSIKVTCLEGVEGKQLRFQISMMSENHPSRIRIRALRSLEEKNSAVVEISLLSGSPATVRLATDEDFSNLIARAS